MKGMMTNTSMGTRRNRSAAVRVSCARSRLRRGRGLGQVGAASESHLTCETPMRQAHYAVPGPAASPAFMARSSAMLVCLARWLSYTLPHTTRSPRERLAVHHLAQ